MSLRERLAIVTGASRGIGRATALALAERKLGLLLLARPSPELDQTRAACLAAGSPSARVLAVDLADQSAIEQAAAALAQSEPVAELLIHSAGLVLRKPVADLSLADWQQQIDVNLTAPFVLTRALLPSMLAQGRGRILFVASISSTLGTPRLSAYCAAKWGIVGFMKSLAEELSDTGLMTAAVLPGSVQTRMLEDSGFTPRMQPANVAQTLVYLALEAPLAHNGASIEMFGV